MLQGFPPTDDRYQDLLTNVRDAIYQAGKYWGNAGFQFATGNRLSPTRDSTRMGRRTMASCRLRAQGGLRPNKSQGNALTCGGHVDEKSLFTEFWSKESKTTSKVLSRIPEGSDYRPDPKSRTAREIAWQIVGEEKMIIDALETGAAEWAPAPAARDDEGTVRRL